MGTTAEDGTAAVDTYLAGLDEPQRTTLMTLRATLSKVLPRAGEAMKYAMPAVVLDGKGIAGYAGFKDHCGYFPMSSEVLVAAGDAVADYPTSKGGLRFPVDRPLPTALVRRLVRLRLAEISAVQDGVRRAYFPDGQLKAVGRMKDGELHGRWEWFRRDGTRSRSGAFDRGRQVGTWSTWDRDGNLVRAVER